MPRTTVRPMPPIADGHFSRVPDVGDVSLGDVIYIPSFLTLSVSTLRSAGMSIGDTCRSANRASHVMNVFGPGHKPMILLVSEIERDETEDTAPRSASYYDALGRRVLRTGLLGAPDGNSIADAEPPPDPNPPKPKITSIRLSAFPLDSLREFFTPAPELEERLSPTRVRKLFESSPAMSQGDFDDRLRELAATVVPSDGEESLLYKEPAGTSGGLETACSTPERAAEWLFGAVMYRVQQLDGGFTPSTFHEPFIRCADSWRPRSEDAPGPERFMTFSDFGPRTGDRYSKCDLSVNWRDADRFVAYLMSRGCAVLRCNSGSLLDQLTAAQLRETADYTAKRLYAIISVISERLPGAAESLAPMLSRYQQGWSRIASTYGHEFDEAAASLAAIAPDVRYITRRRRDNG